MNQKSFAYAFKEYAAFQFEKTKLPKPYGITEDTYKEYFPKADFIEKFLQQNNVKQLSEINLTTGFNLLKWLLSECKVKVSYANKIVNMLKRVLNFAIDHLNALCPTLRSLKLFEERKRKIMLSIDQVKAIKHYDFKNNRLRQVADLFVIQCLTGFGYTDLMNFKKSWLYKNAKGIEFIRYERQKEYGSRALIPVTADLKKLLEKYRFDLPRISNQKYNLYLKDVAELVDIEVNLTTHVARKTAGCLLLNIGHSIEFVSKVLGHASISTTQRYYVEILEERLVLETDKIALSKDAVMLELETYTLANAS